MFTDPDTQQKKKNSELDQWWSKKTNELFLASRKFAFFNIQSEENNKKKEKFLDPIVDEVLKNHYLATKIDRLAEAGNLTEMNKGLAEAKKAVHDAWNKAKPEPGMDKELDGFVNEVQGLINKLDRIFSEINLHA